jgi:predicted nucleic acid-binding protein
LDNTVLTNLALVGRSDLASRLWPTNAYTTPSVRKEHEAGAESGLLAPETWAELPAVTLTPDEVAFANGLPPRLGAGERTCLAVAIHRQGLLVSDDLDARRAAREHNVPTAGTLGILIRCVQLGYLEPDQADGLLAEMIALGYRSPVDSLMQLLERSPIQRSTPTLPAPRAFSERLWTIA